MTRQHIIHACYASFQKKIFSWYGWTGSLLKTHMHVVLILQFYLFFFLAGTIDSLNRTWGKQNLHDWYVCFHYFGQGCVEKSCRDLSHTRGKLYACTRRFGLCFMSRTNKAVATRWLATTTTTTKSCDQHLCIIIQPSFSHLSSLSWLHPPMIQMMRFKLPGGGSTALESIASLSRRRWDDG